MNTSRTIMAFGLLIALTLGAGTAGAEPRRPASELLLPFFEVSLDHDRTTVFDVVNGTDAAISLHLSVQTNWGIALGELDTRLTLGAGDVLAVDLGSWLLGGRLPGKTLSEEQLRHAQAALAGKASALTGLYYATPDADDGDLLVGSLLIRVDGAGRSAAGRALWGNVYVIDAAHGSAQAEALVDVSPDRAATCATHGVRLIEGQGFDAGTELMLWTPAAGQPSSGPDYHEERVETRIIAYDESGGERARILRYLQPLERLRAGELGLPIDFGWLRVETDIASVLVMRYGAGDRYSVAVGSACLEDQDVAVELEKRTNGIDADLPPGPLMDFGDRVEWTYEVNNAGDVTLTGIEVTDDDPQLVVRCPDDALLAGESMTCSASGVATSCSYQNVGRVTAVTPSGATVHAFDSSHYQLRQNGSIAFEALVDGQPAGRSPGPAATCGELVEWSFTVRNTGDTSLGAVTVTNDLGIHVSCPRIRLNVGETMTCTARIPALEGTHSLRSVVTAETPCGVTLGTKLTSHYHGVCPAALIDVEKFTNGEDADVPPGPGIVAGRGVQWAYIVSNPGPIALKGITVFDDDLGPIDCPFSTLAPDEAMVCIHTGVAVEGAYRNEAVATGFTATGERATDTDVSHYLGLPN